MDVAFRDPARINRVLDLLREVWTLDPHFRLGQLLTSLVHPAPLSIEEDSDLEVRLREAAASWRARVGDRDVDRSPWPRVYRVNLRGIEERQTKVVLVQSRLGSYKAVAMAAEYHREDEVDWPIYKVSVDDLGPAPTNPDGTVGMISAGAIEDRAEF
jgi:hypothetical protein